MAGGPPYGNTGRSAPASAPHRDWNRTVETRLLQAMTIATEPTGTNKGMSTDTSRTGGALNLHKAVAIGIAGTSGMTTVKGTTNTRANNTNTTIINANLDGDGDSVSSPRLPPTRPRSHRVQRCNLALRPTLVNECSECFLFSPGYFPAPYLAPPPPPPPSESFPAAWFARLFSCAFHMRVNPMCTALLAQCFRLPAEVCLPFVPLPRLGHLH